MTEKLSIVPIVGLLEWLQQWHPSSQAVRINGCFQPGAHWSEGGTGWLWCESSDDAGKVDESLTRSFATAINTGVERLSLPGRSRFLDAVPLVHGSFVSILLECLESGYGEQLSNSLRLLTRLCQLALKMVDAGDIVAFASPVNSAWDQIIESIYQLSDGNTEEWLPWQAQPKQFCGLWIPAMRTPEFRALRQVYWSQAELLSATTSSWFNPFLCLSVDWWTRQVLSEPVANREEQVSKSSYHVPYRGEKDMMDVWSKALWGESPSASFESDAWLLWRTLRQGLIDSGWKPQWLQDRTGKAYYHLELELKPPLGHASAGDWTLVFHVAHNHWTTDAPLAEWWQVGGRVWRIGQDALIGPDEWILPLLYQMGSLFPPIAEALTKPGPSDCRIPSEQVFEFVTTILPRLQTLGCTCRIPDLKEESLSNIRVRVQVRRTAAAKLRNSVHSQRSTGLFDAEELVGFDWTIVVGDELISRSDFELMVEKNAPFVQLGGSWRLLPVQAIMDQVRMLGSNRAGNVNLLQLSRAVLMSDASAEEEAVRVEVAYEDDDDAFDLDVRRTMEVLSHAHQPEIVPVPKGFNGSLRQYQQVGYSWLLHLRTIGCGGCLADDMGLGKTIQVIAYLLQLEQTNSAHGPHLLLCPTSLVQNWRAELARFGPELKVYVHHGSARNDGDSDEVSALARAAKNHHLIMTTYGTVVRDVDRFSEIAWDVVVTDEAQNIKNHETKQAQAVRSLPSYHRIALTGTPVENRLEELWSIFQFVNPGYLGSLTWFRRVFAGPISVQPDAPSAKQLHRLLRPVLLRRRKTEPEIQLELPEKWEVNEYAGLTPEQAALYQSILNRLFGQMEEIRTQSQTSAMARRGHILSALVRLKQICDHPCLIVGGTGDIGRSGKLKLLMDVLEDVVSDGESALVFTQFRDMGELLCDVILQRFGVRPKFLHGGLTAVQRGQIVEDYQSGRDQSPILVLSLKAGGVGLNLTRANHVFHYDRWWNPAVEDQATDRAFRIGQTRDVQVHRIICSGTLEERIDALIQSKRAVSAAVVGESEGWVTELDDDALRQLFALDLSASMEVEESE